MAEQSGRVIEAGSDAGTSVKEPRHDFGTAASDPAAASSSFSPKSSGYSSAPAPAFYSSTGSGESEGTLSMSSPKFGGPALLTLESHEGSLAQGDSPGGYADSHTSNSANSQSRCNTSAVSVSPEKTVSPDAASDAALNPGSPTFALSDEDRAAIFRHTNAGAAFLPLHGDAPKVDVPSTQTADGLSSSTGKDVAFADPVADGTAEYGAVIWPGQPRTEVESAVVWPGQPQIGFPQPGSYIEPTDPNGMGQMQGINWVAAGAVNEFGSLIVPQTWHYVLPPVPPQNSQSPECTSMYGGSPTLGHLSDPVADAGACAERSATSSEQPRKVKMQAETKTQLLEEVVTALMARCDSVDKELRSERRANRALRATLDAAQRQGMLLQDQINWLTQNYWPAVQEAQAQQYQAAMAQMTPQSNPPPDASSSEGPPNTLNGI